MKSMRQIKNVYCFKYYNVCQDFKSLILSKNSSTVHLSLVKVFLLSLVSDSTRPGSIIMMYLKMHLNWMQLLVICATINKQFKYTNVNVSFLITHNHMIMHYRLT